MTAQKHRIITLNPQDIQKTYVFLVHILQTIHIILICFKIFENKIVEILINFIFESKFTFIFIHFMRFNIDTIISSHSLERVSVEDICFVKKYFSKLCFHQHPQDFTLISLWSIEDRDWNEIILTLNEIQIDLNRSISIYTLEWCKKIWRWIFFVSTKEEKKKKLIEKINIWIHCRVMKIDIITKKKTDECKSNDISLYLIVN